MVGAALKVLQQGHPAWSFVMYDCARPRSVQLIMWELDLTHFGGRFSYAACGMLAATFS